MVKKMMRSIDRLSALLDEQCGPGLANRRKLFEAAADYIYIGMREREAVKKLPPTDTAQGFFKRGAYRLICHFLDAGRDDIIKQFVEGDGNVPPRGPSFADNPFHWGLLAMSKDGKLITKDQRRLYASQMLYAHRHGVPEHFLIGFIYQLGRTDRIFAKVRQGAFEPWFLEEA